MSPPTRPLAKFSAPMRKINVMKLKASVNGGTVQEPTNTAAKAACRIVEKNAATTIQTMTMTSQSGCRNSESPAPTSTPLNPKSPARIAPRSIPMRIAASVETTSPRTPAKPSQGLCHEHRDEDREARQRVVHEDDLTHAAQA